MANKSDLENCENVCNYVTPQEVYQYDSDNTSFDDDDCIVDGSEGQLWLGFLEKPLQKSHLFRHSFPSKAGGTPAWLDPINLPTGKSILCDFCEEPLQFVLQVYAPIIGSESAQRRTIFVFMCKSMICLRGDQNEQREKDKEAKSRSVKVFRCQLPLLNRFYECKDHRDNGSSNDSQLEAPLCSWCGTWKGDQLCTGCRRVRYCSKKHQILHWRSCHKTNCKRSSNSHLHDGASASPKTESGSNILWPEYEIIFERCASNAELSEFNDAGNSLISIQGTDEHMKSILEGYDGDDEKKSLASFGKHIDNDRDQVLRCWLSDGKPLWPELCGRPSITDIPKCSYCDGPMRFEFQIMPQLLYYFGVENEVDSLDWATIAIYACEASCDSAVIYKEEFPWVQLYS